MVATDTTLPKSGVISAPQIRAWLDDLAKQRSSADMARLQTAVHWIQTTQKDRVQLDGMENLLALLHTADILNRLKMDTDTLLAALLSEQPKLADFHPRQLAQTFGESVLRLVQQVSKIRELSASGAQVETQDTEKLRRLLLAVADDVRAILLLLAKRLRLMRNLSRAPAELRKILANETQSVHAPLANRLGIWQLKWELEDLSLRYLQPDVYQHLVDKLAAKRREREAFITDTIQRLEKLCQSRGISTQVAGRPKHIFSIWLKMQRKHLDFEQVLDVRAVRVLVDGVTQCYETLGLAHTTWRPIPGEFDDYIARPKPNGYQSLHTAVIGEDGKPLEIQIRTHAMHEQAERGVAAHWRYKECREQDGELERRIIWLRRWLEEPDRAQSTLEVEDDFTARRIYVLSPQSKVVDLPVGATPVDFAYAIHSDVGHRCRGAKVDGRIVPLSKKLRSGQQVEILTAKQGGPSRDWLNAQAGYVNTSKALNRIRQWFKQQQYGQHVQTGKQILEREIRRLGLPKPDITKLAHAMKYRQDDELLAALGRGDLSAIQVLHIDEPNQSAPPFAEIDQPALRKTSRQPNGGNDTSRQVVVAGISDLLTQMARCCKPVPNDPIIGYITKGRGVTVHRQDCRMIRKLGAAQPERLLEVNWSEQRSDAGFLVDLQVKAADRHGLLNDVSSVLTQAQVEVLSVQSRSNAQKTQTHMRMTLEVRHMAELSRVIERLAQIPDISDVHRIV